MSLARISPAVAPWLALAPWVGLLLFSAGTANAATVGFKVEPDVAIPLTPPQSDRFGVGGGETLKLLVGVTPWLDIGPTASLHLLPALDVADRSGTIWAFGGGLRVKRSHSAEGASGISPWLDADLFYIRTGDLNRPGFDGAVGLAVPLGERRTTWIGPFVRYLQVVQVPDREGYDNRDSRTLTVGLGLEFGTGLEQAPPPEPVVAPPPPCPACPVAAPVCPDRDKDGMPDSVDRCPDIVGLVQDFGCPVYANIVVHPDRIELREKIYFAHDKSTIEQVSYRVLDDVVQAMENDASLRVAINGHTDSTGSDAYNLDLSDRRAAAVVAYLVAHGVVATRLTSHGFGEAVPLESNSTVDGREANRRVEFLVLTLTPTDGSAK